MNAKKKHDNGHKFAPRLLRDLIDEIRAIKEPKKWTQAMIAEKPSGPVSPQFRKCGSPIPTPIGISTGRFCGACNGSVMSLV